MLAGTATHYDPLQQAVCRGGLCAPWLPCTSQSCRPPLRLQGYGSYGGSSGGYGRNQSAGGYGYGAPSYGGPNSYLGKQGY